MLLCQYYYSKPPPGVSLTVFFFTIQTAISRSAHLTPSTSSCTSVIWVTKPAAVAFQFNSGAIKHGGKPVSVLLKQFSMAQGQGSNIFFSSLPACSARGPDGELQLRKTANILASWLFDWPLHLGTERIGPGLTDWCLDAADGFVCLFVLRGLCLCDWPVLMPLTRWSVYPKKKNRDLSLVCLRRKYYTITWIYFSLALCHSYSLLTQSIAAIGVIQSKHVESSAGF